VGKLWLSREPHQVSQCLFTSPQRLLEQVHQMACGQHFMLFTDILRAYHLKNLLMFHNLWLTLAGIRHIRNTMTVGLALVVELDIVVLLCIII